MEGLPKGLRVINGILQARFTYQGRTYSKCFMSDSPIARQVAEIWLADRHKERLLGKIGKQPDLPSKLFKEVAPIWYNLWSKETNSDGTQAHNARSLQETKRVISRVFISYFGSKPFEGIRPIDIERWRITLLQSGLSGTSVNRYQATLSALFNGVEQAVKLERLDAFKLPTENPCKPVEKAPTVKRTRILTQYEAKKLKLAFTTLNDPDGWEICKLALKSVLSEKDLRNLELGQEIDIERAKTGVPVHIPIVYLRKLNWHGWRKRWINATEAAGLAKFTVVTDPEGRTRKVLDKSFKTHVQFRDLRKTGINWLKGRHDLKLISEYAGHADIKTTEQSYTVAQSEILRPLADDLSNQVDGI